MLLVFLLYLYFLLSTYYILLFDITLEIVILILHSAFAAAPLKKRGILFIQSPEGFLYHLIVIPINLTHTRRQTTIINHSHLV